MVLNKFEEKKEEKNFFPFHPKLMNDFFFSIISSFWTISPHFPHFPDFHHQFFTISNNLEGVRYEQGGVGSGFKHVETNAQGEKRLFQVKGKRNVRVRQVNLSVSSMNKGDCFILDAGNDIYVYVGAQAKRVEKLKAISAANQIRDQDHNGRARVQIIGE